MKIYEIRDISNDEVYHTKKYCGTAEEAIAELKSIAEDISDEPKDQECVMGAVYEHELGVWDHEKGFGRRIFEIHHRSEYDEEKDDYKWVAHIEKDYTPEPTTKDKGE